ncbi:MAG: cytochrome b562 [Devosia sp.]|uniref:cytochrome b n=1 Tax=Devosia sp. TaxID=1871048 RepID=UPI00260963C4|nr:cytochrome b/b6 domain-containing protein [Devosia sp.]MDB5531036.1 cytochrome b562 [Devosia sp.]
MATAAKTNGYAPIQIGLHWLIAALVIFQLVFGQSMQTAIHAAQDGTALGVTDAILATGHYWVGSSILVLAILRLVIRLRSGVPAPSEGNKILALAGRATHWLFYVLLVVAPVSGLLTFYGNPGFASVHRLTRSAFIVLIALHAVAALFHHFVLRDGTLKRMLVPAKPSDR